MAHADRLTREPDRAKPAETYRAGLTARRPAGGSCTVLVRRVDDRVELLHHGLRSTAASLTDAQVVELIGYLTAARQRP